MAGSSLQTCILRKCSRVSSFLSFNENAALSQGGKGIIIFFKPKNDQSIHLDIPGVEMSRSGPFKGGNGD